MSYGFIIKKRFRIDTLMKKILRMDNNFYKTEILRKRDQVPIPIPVLNNENRNKKDTVLILNLVDTKKFYTKNSTKFLNPELFLYYF